MKTTLTKWIDGHDDDGVTCFLSLFCTFQLTFSGPIIFFLLGPQLVLSSLREKASIWGKHCLRSLLLYTYLCKILWRVPLQCGDPLILSSLAMTSLHCQIWNMSAGMACEVYPCFSEVALPSCLPHHALRLCRKMMHVSHFYGSPFLARVM